MKVLMTTMKMDIGGAETHILEAARALTERGVTVVVASAGGVFVPALEAAGVRHVEAPLHTKNPADVFRARRILDRLMKTEQFDIVHAHARIPAFLCAPLCRKYQIRFVTTAHLTFAVNALWRRITRWGERSLAVSDDIKQYLIEEYGMCADNIGVTINGINTALYAPVDDLRRAAEDAGLPPDKRRIVLVSRMDADRSEAAVQLADIAPQIAEAVPDAEIVLVGDGNDMPRLKAAADRANQTAGHPVVRLMGARTDISRWIAAGELFVGVSRAAYEAMAMAKPVILAGNEGYLGIFTKDKFAEAYDTNFCCRGSRMTERGTLLADILTLFQMSEAERAQLGADGRAIIETRYSVARMTEDYLAMYRAVRPYHRKKEGGILLCGYYGFRNMGDDSLLRAIVSELRAQNPDVPITVMSKNPRETEEIYGTEAVNRFSLPAVIRAMKRAKLLIFGGGNLLQDGSSARSLVYYTSILKMAHRYGCKVMVYANGIGPLHLESSRRKAAEALALADLLTLREHDSYEFCKKLGIPESRMRLTADPAFALPLPDETWTKRRLAECGIKPGEKCFVVALRDWKENGEEKLQALAARCDELHEAYGLTPVFLPMHDPLDVEINRRAAALCRCQTHMLLRLTGCEVLGILTHMEFVAAMRLHTLIYSTAVGVPSMGLAYDGKLKAFMETMELPYMVDSPMDKEAFLSCAGRLYAGKEEIHTLLLSKKEALVAQAHRDAGEALRLAGALPYGEYTE